MQGRESEHIILPDKRLGGMDNRLLENQMRLLGENYKLTPATLACKLNPAWMPSPHLLYISLKIATAIARGNGRIIISVPPRHGKSELITKYTTIWGLEHYPKDNIILTTYGAELSTDFGRQVRDIIQANTELLSVRIKNDSTRAANWKTSEGGGMAAVGLGGPITGRGANLLLIDDYIKEIREAMSKAYRDYCWNWFVTTAYTRIEPGGTCIIIATRWDDDDLIGRILKYNPGGKWDYIELPAIAFEPGEYADGKGCPLGRTAGQALFPARYPIDALLSIKDTLGSFFFNALYQQRPIADENSLTDGGWLGIVDTPPVLQDMAQARIWDLAATEDGGDWTVGTHMAHDRLSDCTYILNVVRKQASPSSVENLVRQTALSDGFGVPVYIEQEPGASGKALLEHFQRTVLPEFQVVAVTANDGKVTRAQPFIAAAEAGKIKLLRGGWNDKFIEEFARFPNGDHDDQVDTAAVGYSKLSGRKFISATWGRKQEDKKTPSGRSLKKSGERLKARASFRTRRY